MRAKEFKPKSLLFSAVHRGRRQSQTERMRLAFVSQRLPVIFIKNAALRSIAPLAITVAEEGELGRHRYRNHNRRGEVKLGRFFLPRQFLDALDDENQRGGRHDQAVDDRAGAEQCKRGIIGQIRVPRRSINHHHCGNRLGAHLIMREPPAGHF